MKILITFLQAMWTPRLLVLPLLGGLSTYMSWYYGVIYDMNVVLTVFYVGIFFTFGVVMNTVDQRRFQAFDYIAELKSLLLEIAYVLPRATDQIKNLFGMMKSSVLSENAEQQKFSADVDKGFCELQKILRASDLPDPQQAALVTTLIRVHEVFEKLLTIKNYRTPRILRMFLVFSLTSSVFVLAPQFAAMETFGVICSIIVGVLLQLLLEIQDMIEDPFGHDMDDIHHDVFADFEKRI